MNTFAFFQQVSVHMPWQDNIFSVIHVQFLRIIWCRVSVLCVNSMRQTPEQQKTSRKHEWSNLIPRISLYKYQPITNWAVKSYEQWCNNSQMNRINVNKCWQLFIFSFSNLGLVVSELSRLVDVIPRHLAAVLSVHENIFSSWFTLAFTLVCTQGHLSHFGSWREN